MSGGPYDGQVRTLDVTDADNPPERYDVSLHGPHEVRQQVEYRRIRREPGADGGTWVYEALTDLR